MICKQLKKKHQEELYGVKNRLKEEKKRRINLERENTKLKEKIGETSEEKRNQGIDDSLLEIMCKKSEFSSTQEYNSPGLEGINDLLTKKTM